MWGISGLLSGMSSGTIPQCALDRLEHRAFLGISEPLRVKEFGKPPNDVVVSVPEVAGAVAPLGSAQCLGSRTGLLGAVEAGHDPVLVDQLGTDRTGDRPHPLDDEGPELLQQAPRDEAWFHGSP